MLAAIATMGLVAVDSSLVEVFADRCHRFPIKLAETVKAVTRANGQAIEELVELLRHGEVIASRSVGFRRAQWREVLRPAGPSTRLVANLAGAGAIPQPFSINSGGEPFRRGDFPCDAIGITVSNEDDGIAFVNRSKSLDGVAMSDDDRHRAW